MRRRPTQTDYEALAEFRATLRRFLVFSEGAARAAGLTPRQHQALLAIKGAPDGLPLSVGELATRLGLRHNTGVELAKRLLASELSVRATDAADRRRVLLRLSPDGEARLAALSASHLEELRGARPVLRKLLRRLDRG